MNVHTGGSSAEAFENAGCASLAAAVALADKSVEKDARVTAAPSVGSVVGETVDLIVEAFAGLDAAAAASFGVLHVGMEIVAVNHAAEAHDQLVVRAELGGLFLQTVQESERASVLRKREEEHQLSIVEAVQKVFHTE